MIARILIAAVLTIAAPAHAQVVRQPTPDLSAIPTKAEVDAARAAAQQAASDAAAARAAATAAATPASVASAVSASQATIMASMPQPSAVVGAGEAVGGQVGSSTRYKREDWVPPRRSRTGLCVLPATGVCTVPWSTPFSTGESPVMLGDPVATNTSALQPISCNVTGAPTIAGVPVKCWQAQPTVLGASLLSIANLAINPFGTGTLTGVVVTAAAIPGSQ